MRVGALFVLLFPASLKAADTSCRDCNVILICFDTLRADRLGALNYSRPITPNLDALAAKSFFFSDAVSQAAWTLPSIMSVFTSMYPHQHQVTNKYAVFLDTRKELSRLRPQLTTMAEAFKKNGYLTAAFTGGASLSGYHGFGDGFDIYEDTETFGGFDRTFPQGLAWLQKNRKKKSFLFIHGYDVHGQYDKLEEIKSRFADADYRGPYHGSRDEFLELRMKTIKNEPIRMTPADAQVWRDRYDEQVAQADARLGEFLERLAELRLRRPTVVALFSDHGDQFYEHGGFDHGMTLHEEIVHVPVLLTVPGSKGRRIDAQIRLIDVFPTLAGIVEMKKDPTLLAQWQGTDLAPLMRGESSALEAFSETDFLLHTFKRSLRTEEHWKFIVDIFSHGKELYDLSADPKESHNSVDEEKDRARSMEDRLNVWVGGNPR